MADIDNVKLGVCSVSFNGVDLGHTKGGVVVNYEPTIHRVEVDKYGKSLAKPILIGEKFSVEVPLAEFTLANLQVGLPAGTDATDAVTLGREAGYDLSAEAATLVLHPIANEASDRSEDVVLYKAVVTEAVELSYMVDGERVIKVTFEAMIDETKSDGNLLGLMGDSDA